MRGRVVVAVGDVVVVDGEQGVEGSVRRGDGVNSLFGEHANDERRKKSPRMLSLQPSATTPTEVTSIVHRLSFQGYCRVVFGHALSLFGLLRALNARANSVHRVQQTECDKDLPFEEEH